LSEKIWLNLTSSLGWLQPVNGSTIFVGVIGNSNFNEFSLVSFFWEIDDESRPKEWSRVVKFERSLLPTEINVSGLSDFLLDFVDIKTHNIEDNMINGFGNNFQKVCGNGVNFLSLEADIVVKDNMLSSNFVNIRVGTWINWVANLSESNVYQGNE